MRAREAQRKDGMKVLYENLTIAIDQEGDIFRAYAFNAETEQNVATCKCSRKDGAVSGLFETLRKDANNKAKTV